MSQFEHISVIVQGPVQNTPDRTHHEAGITQRCLSSIRTFLPGARIILSTWTNQDLTGLEYDELVISDDPGQNTDGFCPKNYYRQITSSKAGLSRVTTPYAVKLRTDNFLIGNEFVALQQQYPANNPADKLFTEKVVINANLFRKSSHGRDVIMSPSDFFYFGRTEDLNKIWQQPPFLEQSFAQQLLEKHRRKQGKFPLEAEQAYCQIWLRRLTEQAPLMAHRFDHRAPDLLFWQRFLASNIVIVEPEIMGLGLRKISQRKFKRANEFSHIDWLKLYKTHCDSTVHIPFTLEQLRLSLVRLVKNCRPIK
ncbi:WavE lipopolysaccharide synthesis family protein [Motilimonas sp. 1_MG-2023]|uniref:WavE lipopolysaccharide synthesis family protein n=1 Tax=Motilimonas sp. 1_MG-2023 TaxID=3062672 RepID=UPI0026E33889|nr:WavE lipopolysaccharide synthesis family protein [Motilimonas sp. 1_MG-2023]MDO6526828.1 WavE lipopolysaccharide synthesis family protein [Motilimonas sp. 1_MG-2023]